jgi:hypothetical protein
MSEFTITNRFDTSSSYFTEWDPEFIQSKWWHEEDLRTSVTSFISQRHART